MIFTNNVQIHLTGFIVEKMYADGSGKFDKDWRRINLTAALRPGTESAGGRWPTANTPLPKFSELHK